MALTPEREPHRGRGPKGLVEVPIPTQDVRRRRPPLLSFLLRLDTLRRGGRVLTLVALDIAAVFLGIFTALAVKAELRGALDVDAAFHQTKDIVALATLVTLLLFARSGLYADRNQRPGFARIVGALFQVAVVALLFAVINGNDFSSYYIFYGSLFFCVLYVTGFRRLYESVTGLILRAAGYQRRAVLVGSGHHIEAVAHALDDAPHSPIRVVGFISLTPRPDNGLRSLGRLDELGRIIGDHKIDG
jgi:FlaA1/EpsC-like NDP-sugar epimerase